jgi:hypothetical protein
VRDVRGYDHVNKGDVFAKLPPFFATVWVIQKADVDSLTL